MVTASMTSAMLPLQESAAVQVTLVLYDRFDGMDRFDGP